MLIALIALAFIVVGIVVVVTQRAPWYAGAVLIAVGVLIYAVFHGNANENGDLGLMATVIPIRFTRRRTRITSRKARS